MEFFSINIFGAIPNILESSENNMECHLHPVLLKNDLKCLSINNVGNLVIQVAFMFLLKALLLIAHGIVKLVNRKNKNEEKEGDNEKEEKEKEKENLENKKSKISEKIEKVFAYLNKKTSYAAYWGVYNAMIMDLAIGSWSTLKIVKINEAVPVLSIFILLFTVLNFIGYLFFIIVALV